MAKKILTFFGYQQDSNIYDDSIQKRNCIEKSEQYCRFRSQIALRRYALDDDENNAKDWSVFECGPKEINCPVIFFPPISGSADVFFLQLQYLSDHGHRVISAEYPSYYLIEDFVAGFRRFIEYFKFEKVHIFGASLGGFLAQKFAEVHPNLVASLILCNSFADTCRFKLVNIVPIIWINPAPVLRKIFTTNKVPKTADDKIKNAVEFMTSKLENLSHEQLISRLYLNLTENHIQPDNIQSIPVTIIDVFDECSNSDHTREELYKMYPNAKLAHLKSGGNFPYLSRSEEVNMHLVVHLRQFQGTKYSSSLPMTDEE
ncbi:abhydrolase domain-containing protein [Sarcoptes scabiei]|uniref:Maspardin n=1 Tax=Sarcoptes scabiei TaxID=52283 RepID=A0A132AAT0_SARSC|nr:abhydrolase domain-containing protein [Sarcoptes scabiei]